MVLIEPNIKQFYLPFVLNKDITINNTLLQSGATAGNQYQLFTFRGDSANSNELYSAAKGKLNLFPTAVANGINRSLKFNSDIANKLLFDRSETLNANATSNKCITFDSLMDSLPAVQIREFQPDSTLDNMLNFFGALWRAVMNVLGADSEKSANDRGFIDKLKLVFDSKNNAQFMKKIGALGSYVYDYLGQNELYDLKWGRTSIIDNKFTGKANVGGLKVTGQTSKICEFPFSIYYKLQSSLTTNIYEIPALIQEKMMYSSDGYKGWTSGNTNNMSISNIPGMGILSKLPFGIGSLLNGAMQNISINYTPMWAPKEGGAVCEPEVTVQFDLFNDSYDAAMMNFIFVNTIIPNNRFVQYGMLQHSPSLYDIKIEGFNRLYMCAGKFSVEQNGVMRKPSPKFIHDLCYKYFSNAEQKGSQLEKAMLHENIIKIPDVYRVQMKFQSLLPASFNTYLYTFIANEAIDQTVQENGLYQDSSYEKIVPKLENTIVGAAVNYWNGDTTNAEGKTINQVIGD